MTSDGALRFQVDRSDLYEIGLAGWVRYQAGRLPFPVFLHATDNGDGRLEIDELYIAARRPPERPSPGSRKQPVLPAEGGEAGSRGRITGDLLRQLELNRIEVALNSAFSGPIREGLERPRIGVSELAASFFPYYSARGAEFRVEPLLDIPTSRHYPESFYVRLADVYSKLASLTRAPARVIAEANDVPVARVHEWVKVARARKLLPPGRQGKAG